MFDFFMSLLSFDSIGDRISRIHRHPPLNHGTLSMIFPRGDSDSPFFHPMTDWLRTGTISSPPPVDSNEYPSVWSSAKTATGPLHHRHWCWLCHLTPPPTTKQGILQRATTPWPLARGTERAELLRDSRFQLLTHYMILRTKYADWLMRFLTVCFSLYSTAYIINSPTAHDGRDGPFSGHSSRPLGFSCHLMVQLPRKSPLSRSYIDCQFNYVCCGYLWAHYLIRWSLKSIVASSWMVLVLWQN